MLLAVDAGNTNTVFALFKDRELVRSWRCKTDSGRTADEYAAFLAPLLAEAGLGFSDVQATIVCSVVPEANRNLETLCRSRFGSPPLTIGEDGIMPDIEIRIDNPKEVGADRIVNAVAVRTFYTCPAIVIDFGTATTFDVVSAGGTYCGGVIAPGVRLSLDALRRAAAKLPHIAISRPDSVVGKNTVSAMRSGLYWGYLSMIEGLVDRLSREMGDPAPLVLATGGLASLFSGQTNRIHTLDENLTLRGLLHIYETFGTSE